MTTNEAIASLLPMIVAVTIALLVRTIHGGMIEAFVAGVAASLIVGMIEIIAIPAWWLRSTNSVIGR